VSTAPAVAPLSADGLGVAVITGTTFAPDRGLGGSVFSAARLAGGELVHVHPLPDGEVLLAYGVTRHSGTLSGQGYTGYQTLHSPRLLRSHPATGGTTPVPDRGAEPGRMHTDLGYPATLRLVDGTSAGSKVIYLSTLEQSGDRVGQLTVYETVSGAIRHAAEVLLPDLVLPGKRIRWDRGVFVERGFLVVAGADETGAIHLRALPLDADLTTGRWTFCNGSGWGAYPQQIAPLSAVDGTVIISAGPISVALTHGKALASAVRVVGNRAYAQLFYGGIFDLAPLPAPINLGLTTDGSFLGGGVRLQQSLPANGEHPILADQRYGAGVPYCLTTATAALMSTAWGILGIPRTGGFATGWVPRDMPESWWAGQGVPGTIAGSAVGDRYVDVTSGTTYRQT